MRPYTGGVRQTDAVSVAVEFNTPIFDEIPLSPRGANRVAPKTPDGSSN